MKPKPVLTLVLTLLIGNFYAQDFFNDYKDDGNTYLKYYAAPIFETNLFNFSDGWSHQAKTLKPGKFSFEITANYTFIPEEKQTFVFDPSEYDYVEVIDASNNPVSGSVELPTAFGPENTPYKLRIKAPADVPNTYNQVIIDALPGGKDKLEEVLNGFPVGMPGAMAQVRVGLPLSFEVAVRFFPNSTFGTTQVNFLGVGLKHDIGQYLFKNEKLHLAALASFTSGNVQAQAPNTSDLEARFKINTYNLQAFVSYDWKFFSIYGSTGITQGSSRLQVTGEVTYDYDVVDSGGTHLTTLSETVKDPLDLKHSLFTVKSSVGMLLNLKVLHIFVQYNLQKYSGVHAGIGINL